MISYYRDKAIFTIDNEHGFGVMYNIDEAQNTCSCFYEDETISAQKATTGYSEQIHYLENIESYGWFRFSKQDNQTLSRLLEQGSCRFFLDEKGAVSAELNEGKNKSLLYLQTKTYRCAAVCSCGKTDCVHARAAGVFLKKRLTDLKHSYIVSDKQVNKSLFLDPFLITALDNLDELSVDEELIRAEKTIINLVGSANSDDYYWLFHNYLLSLSDYEYDSHMLEDYCSFLLLALFDTPGYRDAVLSTGSFADPLAYEERQYRSNRVCLKRILKEYNMANKEMDSYDNFREHIYKEFLLKYRGDHVRLLHYYALGKPQLQAFDYPFLEKIVQTAEAGQSAISLKDIPPVMVKLDSHSNDATAVSLLHRYAALLPHEEKIRTYSKLANTSMTLDEILSLPEDEQRKLIYSMPLTNKSIAHIMDNLLAGQSDREKGFFIIKTAHRFHAADGSEIKKTLIQYASMLPDNQLLLAHVSSVLFMSKYFKRHKGTPEKELSTYFDCSYKIVNTGDSFYTEYSISVPESGQVLLSAKEKAGKLTSGTDSYSKVQYPSSIIRQVCLRGREEEYKKELEKNQQAVDAFLFEQNNRKFAHEYRQLCDSLTDEKLLFTDNAKAEIEWLLYRSDNHNALAFRVGHRKKYVVKDAQEFLKAFRTGQTTKYGKDLILTHDTNNLDDADAAIIKLLTAAKTTKGIYGDRNNKRYITISDAIMVNMLEHLSGRTVFFNELPCMLRMNPMKVRLKVDDRFTLSTDLDNDTQTLMNLNGKGYVLSRQTAKGTQVIDRIDCSAEEVRLVDLVNRNPSVNVKPILPDFKKNIYSRFFDMMDVDQKVQKDFVLSQMRCSTYFDFEKSVITAKTVLSKEGKEISAEKLTDRIDQQKIDLLESYLSALGFKNGIMDDEGHILSFFKLDFTRLKKLTNVYLSETLKSKELRSVGKPVIRVSYQNNLVNVFLEKSDFNDEEMEKIIAALKKKKKFILLSGDRIIDLDSETAKDLGEAVKDFGMDPKALHKEKTISMVAAIKAFSHERSCSIDKYLRGMIEEIRSFKEADITLPTLSGELRDYQAEGYRWMSVLSKYHMGGILADDMGLGKTIQVIALIKADRSKKPSLVVCPKSLVFNWVSEFARFDGETKVISIYGPESQRSDRIAKINYKEKAVYVTSYDSLRNDIEKYKGEFNYSILDEAQYIKNIHALKTRSVKEIKAAHRFALTGTPIENSVVDLWSIFDYIMPGYFEELSQFKDSDTSAIAKKSAPFILRRVKEDVLEDLPPKYETILSADMSDTQRKLYEALRQDARKQLESGGKAFDILPYLTRLRQVCVDPAMFVEDYHGGSGKLELLKTLIPEYLEKGHRILIFSQFVKALESVKQLLEKLGIPAYFLSGATSAEDRVQMMDSFNNGSGTDVFLISLKAGGTGLNLTGADTVIHLDPWWNVAAENQASDRTHRIGQTRNVEVIKVIAEDSIEQRVVELQNIKKEVIRQVISDNDGSVTSASLEDIAFVLE